MISLAARGGIKVDDILDQLKSCGVCPSYAVRSATKFDTSKGSSCPVAVGNALKDMYKEIKDIICKCNKKVIEEKPTISEDNNLVECPNCHEKTLIHVGGCVQCNSCGFSKCS
jgi:ribonucleoside-diphosphate reductase alpha chain